MNASWKSLPTEMKLSIVDNLDLDDVKGLAKVDQSTYRACLPAIFKNVKLNDFYALERFLEQVPRSYCRYIQRLDIIVATEHDVRARTEAVIAVLVASVCLQQLSIQMAGSLDKSIIPCFRYLHNLEHLTLKNSAQEEQYPMSERLVVSIAAAIPNLKHLSLERVSRSVVHAPELVGLYPYVPLVSGDDDIPNHPILGSELCLPSLLRLPTLTELIIRDTHLGDSRWATTPVACRLQVLDVGSCCHESEDSNRICTERIMSAVGRTVDEFSLTTSVSDAIFAKPCATPLQRLRKLHISPFFPVDSVVDTVSNLAGSPIESLSLQCYEDDVVDVCAALEEFLTLRVERGSDFYEKLTRIDVTIAATDDGHPVDFEASSERVQAAKRLQDFCRDLRLAGRVRAKSAVSSALNQGRISRFATKWPSVGDGRVRSMTV
ncbi:hypothetical protein C8J56DRAFT_916300 [Mycena floridula]|nr:hypothetical protein C8J56DRAFT_916300 [Mycena floridula]